MNISDLFSQFFATTLNFNIKRPTYNGVTTVRIEWKPLPNVEQLVTIDDKPVAITEDVINDLFASNGINAVASLKTKDAQYKSSDGAIGYYQYTRYAITPIETLSDANKSEIDSMC